MATLGSPGVQVKVIDESFYTPAAPGTTPLVFVATAENKQNASGTGVARGTLAANAGNVYVITSQRDLTDTFGTPLFYTDSNGNAINGGEQNEYGLQAAYSLLGASSKAYVVRADVDLKAISATTSEPTGTPVAGTYWLDTANSLYGVNEWNSSTQQFKLITPLVINDSSTGIASIDVGGMPVDGYGKPGDYAIYVTSDNGVHNPNALFYKTTATSNAWVAVQNGFNAGKSVQISPHTQYPQWTNSTPNGSVWVKTTTPGYGANWVVKYYNGSTQAWTTVNAPMYNSTRQAIEKLDYAGGGQNIPVGTLFVETDPDHYGIYGSTATVEFKVWRRGVVAPTSITSTAVTTATVNSSNTFLMRETLASSSAWGNEVGITIPASTTIPVAQLIANAINVSSLVNIHASYDSNTQLLTISHALGGDFEFNDPNGIFATCHLTPYSFSTNSGTPNLYTAGAQDALPFIATGWKPLAYEALSTTPTVKPNDGTLWYDSAFGIVDIMYNNGTHWVGYKNAFPNTDSNGPIVAAIAPTQQVGGHNGNYTLQNGDIWVSTANMEKFGQVIYVYNGNTLKWDLQDTTDHISPNGWVYHDARWSGAGDDTMPDPITKLLTYNYVDPDCIDPALYPQGTRLWNLRRSGFNIKKYVKNYINVNANNGLNTLYQNDPMANYNPDRWVTVSPNDHKERGSFGRHAQRAFVVSKIKAMIDTNSAIRDTDTLLFNLIAAPGYPEAIQNMIAFNTDIGQTAFVVGDTPFRLEPSGTSLLTWGSNKALATDNGDEGAVSYDPYMSMFYPSGYTNDNAGNNIVVPPSHMMLRTIINSDAKSYPWFAPAGTNRGTIDNATSVGYIDGQTGEFNTVSLYESLRDVMAQVKINPIATLPGVGIVNMGQYTRAHAATALDRINVARLIGYLRRQLTILAKPFLFEPNDAQTRNEIKSAAQSLLLELVGQRALYDFVVVCDTSNNTPARISRSELWLDIAIEPVKAVEFIYIPLRILNTGAIASGNFGSTAK
jgi:hypothetical protein